MPHFPAEEVGLNALWCKAFESEITPVLPYQKYITLRKKTTIPPKKNRAVARRPIRRRPIPRTPTTEGAYADGRGLSYFSALFQLFARGLRTFSKLFELFSSALFLPFLRSFPPHPTQYLPLGEGIARAFSVSFVKGSPVLGSAKRSTWPAYYPYDYTEEAYLCAALSP